MNDDNDDVIDNIQQRPEDFMDEQDHNEWGGPVRMHQQYQGAVVGEVSGEDESSSLSKKRVKSTSDALGDVLWKEPVVNRNLGEQLLRVWGWREGAESAFVPTNSEERFAGIESSAGDNDDDEETKQLSKRQLRKIQFQQKRAQIPQPKLDTAGLGFEPFEDAPEFKRHRDQRRKRAQERAQGNGRKVYRVADVFCQEDDVDGRPKFRDTKRSKSGSDDDPYVSFETVEDFVGTRTTGGFALHDDQDDAYDDDQVDRDAFETEVYEHNSDEEDAQVTSISKGAPPSKNVFGSALSDWTSAPPKQGNGDTKPAMYTADGRPPLPGFMLGGRDGTTTATRFPGPDLPPGYEVCRHVFPDDEHPMVLKALSHAEKLVAADQKKKAVVQDALASNAAANIPSRVSVGIKQKVFSGISSALKSRFTSPSGIKEEAPRASGLSCSSDYVSGAVDDQMEKTVINEKGSDAISIKRTMVPFVPEPLLCKRFKVPMPKNLVRSHDDAASGTREETYFHKEILSKAKAAKPNKSVQW